MMSPDSESQLPHVEHREKAMVPDDVPPAPRFTWPRLRDTFQDAFGEFFGTMILVLFGDGSIAQVVLSGRKNGDFSSIPLGWGIGLMLGAVVAGRSGGHLNPAVTFANCVFRKFPWRRFPAYALAQLLGAMAGAAILYGNYKSAIDALEGGGGGVRTVGLNTSTAGIFATYPAPFMSRTGSFFSEFLGSALLLFGIYAIVDNAAPAVVPVMLFFLFAGLLACFGWETGAALNLARDFGPRLVTYGLGYGKDVWSAGGYYFWIPMVSPFFGCLTGGFLYDVFLHTGGDSPINNSPFLGLKRLAQPKRNVWSNTRAKNMV